MKFDALIDRIGSRLNPILVKEVRQAVRSRLVIGVFLALLLVFALIALFVSWFVAANLLDITNYSSGYSSYSYGYRRNRITPGIIFFLWVYGVVAFATLFFVPAYAGFRIGFERSGQDPDLLFITSLKPSSIIRGKASVAGLLALFFISAALPFMAFAYLLRGIDIPNVLLVMLLTFVASCVASSLAILIGAVPTRNKVGKVVLLMVALLGLFNLAVGAIGLGIAIMTDGGFTGFVGSSTGLAELATGIGVALTAGCAIIWLSHSLSSALIAPPPSNRIFPVRVCVSICFIVLGAILLSLDAFFGDDEGLVTLIVIGGILFGLGMLLSICERERPGPRVAKAIPRNPLGRLAAFPFFTGSANGIIWNLGLGAITLLLTVAYFYWHDDIDPLWFTATWIFYIYAYCITALLIRRTLFKNVFRPAHTWLIALILISLISLLTFFISDIIFASMGMNINLPYGNLGKFFVETDERDHLAFALVWAILVSLFWFPIAFRQIEAFTPMAEDAGRLPEMENAHSPAMTDGAFGG